MLLLSKAIPLKLSLTGGARRNIVHTSGLRVVKITEHVSTVLGHLHT